MKKNLLFAYAKNKRSDQMRGNCTADQRLCFRQIYFTIPLLQTYKISSLQQYSLAVKPVLCWTWLETKEIGPAHLLVS